MKNIKDRINSQLFKAQEVELSAEKVELGLVQDVENKIKSLDKRNNESLALRDSHAKAEKELVDAWDRAVKLFDKASPMMKKITSEFDELKGDFDKYKKALKDLGLSDANNITRKFESLEQNMRNSKKFWDNKKRPSIKF